MPYCPTCGENAEHGVDRGSSKEVGAGTPIRVCHYEARAYVHVLNEVES
jgi:hypothetical protein